MGKVICVPDSSLAEARKAFPQYEYEADFLYKLHHLPKDAKLNPIRELAEYGFVHFIC